MFPLVLHNSIITAPRGLTELPAWQLRFEAKTEEIDCNGAQDFFVISTVDLG